MRSKDLFSVALKAAVALLGGGLFYALWLGVYLLTEPLDISALQIALWLLAPAITALGFAAGSLVYDRLRGQRRESFLKALVWPLVACTAGAIFVYRLGPMLISFAMLWFGTLAVALREFSARMQ